LKVSLNKIKIYIKLFNFKIKEKLKISENTLEKEIKRSEKLTNVKRLI
jgi:hypothetical protein